MVSNVICCFGFVEPYWDVPNGIEDEEMPWPKLLIGREWSESNTFTRKL